MISHRLLAELYPLAPSDHLQIFAEAAGPLLTRFGIGATTTRLAFFLAQIGHESAGLTALEENLNYRAERLCEIWPSRFATLPAAAPFAGNAQRLANRIYAGRMGNGDDGSGDGWRYRGRGYIQVTGRDAYRAIGLAIGLALEASPELVAEPKHALLVACGFWQWKGLNPLCDVGDFIAVTRRINGATTGLDDRRAWLDKVRRSLALPGIEAEQPNVDMAVALQRGLQARGYSEIGAADGVIGRRTLAAIARFRQEHGLGEGGIDHALMAALGLAWA